MKKLVFILFSIALSSILLISSCCKKPCPPKATVYVVDDAGNPVEGAKIIIQANEGNSVYLKDAVKNQEISQTNEAGQSSYEFRYEAIYNVKVTLPISFANPTEKTGIGVLILKEDKTCVEKIVIR